MAGKSISMIFQKRSTRTRCVRVTCICVYPCFQNRSTQLIPPHPFVNQSSDRGCRPPPNLSIIKTQRVDRDGHGDAGRARALPGAAGHPAGGQRVAQGKHGQKTKKGMDRQTRVDAPPGFPSWVDQSNHFLSPNPPPIEIVPQIAGHGVRPLALQLPHPRARLRPPRRGGPLPVLRRAGYAQQAHTHTTRWADCFFMFMPSMFFGLMVVLWARSLPYISGRMRLTDWPPLHIH